MSPSARAVLPLGKAAGRPSAVHRSEFLCTAVCKGDVLSHKHSSSCTVLPLGFPATKSTLPHAQPGVSAEAQELCGAIKQPGVCQGMTCPGEADELAC